MSDQPKLLWHSNAPFSPTGYGQQTDLITPLLTEDYDVAISSFYGLNGARLRYGAADISILPGFEGDYGDRTLPMHAERFFGELRGGLVVTLMDVWVLSPHRMRHLDMACWVPIDHEPAPPMVRRFFAESGAIPLAMSKFGMKQLAEFDPIYVPHAVDTSIYKPSDRDEAREFTQLPKDAFIVGVIAANKGNPSRKAFAEALLAFKRFHDTHPTARLYLHAELSGAVDGVQLPTLIDNVGLSRDSVLFADQYRVQLFPFSGEQMAQIYNSLDVLLAASCGEGFGIPVLEAQACGVPAIVTDFSAQPELCGSGWTVEHSPYYTSQNSWQAHPDVDDMVDALNRSYDALASEDGRKLLADKATKHAVQYEVGHVMELHMLPALEKARERIAQREPVELKAAA
jgi:glycosyltransferase involved in cell wall biosynthesis